MRNEKNLSETFVKRKGTSFNRLDTLPDYRTKDERASWRNGIDSGSRDQLGRPQRDGETH